MKPFRISLMVLFALAGLVLLAGLLAPKEVKTERTALIDAPRELVFNTVNDLSTWEHWSSWKENDPSIQVALGEQTAGMGAVYTWTSEEDGGGKLTISASDPPKRLETEIAFDGMGTARSGWTFDPEEQGTRVTWSFHTRIPFPWNAFMIFQDIKGMIEKDFDRGLALLKAYVEKKAVNMPLEVMEISMPYRYVVGVRQTVSMPEMQAFYQENFAATLAALQASGTSMAGMPCGLYFTWDEAGRLTDMLAGIPVGEKVEPGGKFTTVLLPEGQALLVNYYGPYEGIGRAHEAIDAFIAGSGWVQGAPVMEEYVIGPATEPDTARWLTKVIYPVSKS